MDFITTFSVVVLSVSAVVISLWALITSMAVPPMFKIKDELMNEINTKGPAPVHADKIKALEEKIRLLERYLDISTYTYTTYEYRKNGKKPS